jgi:hypothetical protein
MGLPAAQAGEGRSQQAASMIMAILINRDRNSAVWLKPGFDKNRDTKSVMRCILPSLKEAKSCAETAVRGGEVIATETGCCTANR